MSTISANQKVNAKDEVENDQAFSLAKEALSYIGTFRTPPTPEVYEVWYRYVEGGNKAIQAQLSYAVHVAKSVSTVQLLELRQQFLNTSDTAEANHQISLKLATEMDGLQSLVCTQQGAIVEYGDSIASANDRLLDETITTEEIKSSLSLVLQGNNKMQQHIADMDSKLHASKSHLVGLREDLDELQKLILLDPLTGIGNRRLFDETILRANDSGKIATPYYLFLIDLDKFKDINDTHGHGTSTLNHCTLRLRRCSKACRFNLHHFRKLCQRLAFIFSQMVSIISMSGAQTVSGSGCNNTAAQARLITAHLSLFA